MSNYSYVAVDPAGTEIRGNLDVLDQMEAVRRIKEMGLFPTRILAERKRRSSASAAESNSATCSKSRKLLIPGFARHVPATALTVFTRQTATMLEAGMPLIRGLRILQEQEENRTLRTIIQGICGDIENGGSFAEALARYPKAFNPLYVNMVKAGEVGGALELALIRLSEFLERAQKIKAKVKTAMFYPCAVLLVAVGILAVMMVFVVPRFQEVFTGLLGDRAMPAFTLFVLGLSQAAKSHLLLALFAVAGLGAAFSLLLSTKNGRQIFDRIKLCVPAVGPVLRKAAISRFARTLGTLLGSGVPILQALAIVQETAGNFVLRNVIGTLHARVKEGDAIAPALRNSTVFPPMVAGMVDVGEQTGALPEMLMRVADNYDEEVDNAANAMTSLLEPIMIVFLAVVVGSIVIAMFLPLVRIMTEFGVQPGQGEN